MKTGAALDVIRLSDVPRLKKPVHGQRWGDWKYDAKLRTLTFGPTEYWIDLERAGQSSAELLDWIFQIHLKTWATEKVTKDMLRALQAILTPQATLCSGGRERGPFKWTK